MSIPTEHEEQVLLFSWASMMSGKYPELAFMFAIPNGATYAGKGMAERRIAAIRGNAMRCEGVKSGVPDIFLPVAKKGFNGLFIEMKRIKGGEVKHNQAKYIDFLNTQGYKAVVCKGFDEAKSVIEEYLNE